jgi:hypothetical protein
MGQQHQPGWVFGSLAVAGGGTPVRRGAARFAPHLNLVKRAVALGLGFLENYARSCTSSRRHRFPLEHPEVHEGLNFVHDFLLASLVVRGRKRGQNGAGPGTFSSNFTVPDESPSSFVPCW